MELVAAVLAGFVLVGAAVAAAPRVWAFVKALCRAPLVVEAMYEEFSPNGGSTMRDSLDRIERKVARHDHRLAQIESRLVDR